MSLAIPIIKQVECHHPLCLAYQPFPTVAIFLTNTTLFIPSWGNAFLSSLPGQLLHILQDLALSSMRPSLLFPQQWSRLPLNPYCAMVQSVPNDMHLFLCLSSPPGCVFQKGRRSLSMIPSPGRSAKQAYRVGRDVSVAQKRCSGPFDLAVSGRAVQVCIS